jgi:hypothetical protein
LSNAPKAVDMLAAEQAGKVTVAAETVFWGCAVKNIRATLPFYGVR